MSEEMIASKTVVKELCFAAWIVQECSRLRGAPSKSQALAMVENYFNEDVEQPVKKATRQKAGKLDAKERADFLAWVSDKLGHELDAKEITRYNGMFNWHKTHGNDPYEQAFKENAKGKGGKVGRKPDPKFKAWLEEHERVKGAPLTDKERTSLRNKWYSSYKFVENPPVWDNRGVWPTCALRVYENGTSSITLSVNGCIPVSWQPFKDINEAEYRRKQLDEWMIQLREGRTPDQVFQIVMQYQKTEIQ